MTCSSSKPGISVAMATYNGEKHIQEQLDSIARQTVRPIELVATDDGSTDATRRILEDFARVAPFPVRIYCNESRLGYADNFLRAASLCQGELIAFCDQDDIWMEQKLEVCAAFFADAGTVLATHSAWTLLRSGERGRPFPHYSRTRVWEPGSRDPFGFPHGFAMVFRKELLSITGATSRPQKVFGHDQWCWLLACSSGRIATIAGSLALYRQHENNLYGARQPGTLATMAKSSVDTLEYDTVADAELACSHLLQTASEQNPERAKTLSRASQKIERRAQLHRMRSNIYRKNSNALRRAVIFGRILFSGGYLPDESRTRLGARAGAKDLLYGVIGCYKLFGRNAL